MKRCSTLIFIREMEIKMKYHFTSIWNNDTTKCWWEGEATGTLDHCWWEHRMVQILWNTVWCFLAKVSILLPNNLVSECTYWYLLKGVENICPQKKKCSLMLEQGIWEISIFSSWFCCKPKAVSKYKVFHKNKPINKKRLSNSLNMKSIEEKRW